MLSRSGKKSAGRRWAIAAGASLALVVSTWALYRLVNARGAARLRAHGLELIIQGLHQRGYRMATLNEMRAGGACAG